MSNSKLFKLAHVITRQIKGDTNYHATFSLVLAELYNRSKVVSLQALEDSVRKGLNVFRISDTTELLNLALSMSDIVTVYCCIKDYADVVVIDKGSHVDIKSESTYIQVWEEVNGLNGEVIISGTL